MIITLNVLEKQCFEYGGVIPNAKMLQRRVFEG